MLDFYLFIIFLFDSENLPSFGGSIGLLLLGRRFVAGDDIMEINGDGEESFDKKCRY